MTDALFKVVSYVGVLIIGALLGSFITHRLTLGRERESGRDKRKREFRSFIVRFKEEAIAGGIIGARANIGHLTRSQVFAVFYREKKPELRTAAANIENDFPGKQRAQFDGLVNTAASLTDAEAMADNGKQRVIASLDAILQFLDA